MERFYFVYKSEIGEIVINYNENGINSIILPYDNSTDNFIGEYKENEVIKRYMEDYFAGKEVVAPPLDISITDFQWKVFQVLLSTKRGTYLTYGDIADIIGCKSPRAIGQALRKNPVPIVIPCHRVVGKGWDGGFAGATDGPKMDVKKYLLEIERKG